MRMCQEVDIVLHPPYVRIFLHQFVVFKLGIQSCPSVWSQHTWNKFFGQVVNLPYQVGDCRTHATLDVNLRHGEPGARQSFHHRHVKPVEHASLFAVHRQGLKAISVHSP